MITRLPFIFCFYLEKHASFFIPHSTQPYSLSLYHYVHLDFISLSLSLSLSLSFSLSLSLSLLVRLIWMKSEHNPPYPNPPRSLLIPLKGGCYPYTALAPYPIQPHIPEPLTEGAVIPCRFLVIWYISTPQSPHWRVLTLPVILLWIC